MSPGSVEINTPISAGNLQQHGFAHAGVTFAIGDSAAGYAALTLLETESEVTTVEMKINLLRPALGDRLIADGRVLKPGRRISVVAADVFAETGAERKQIAALQGTMISV